MLLHTFDQNTMANIHISAELPFAVSERFVNIVNSYGFNYLYKDLDFLKGYVTCRMKHINHIKYVFQEIESDFLRCGSMVVHMHVHVHVLRLALWWKLGLCCSLGKIC